MTKNFDEIERLVARRLSGDRFVVGDVDRAMTWMRALRGTWVTSNELQSIEVSTLVIGAGSNRWHAGPTPAMSRAIAAAIPAAHLTMFENLGPLLVVEEPDAVLAAFESWLEKRLHQESR